MGRLVCLLTDSLLFLYNSELQPPTSFFSFNICPPKVVIFSRVLSLVPHTFNPLSSFGFPSSQCSNQVGLSSVLSISHSKLNYLFLEVILIVLGSHCPPLSKCNFYLHKTIHSGMGQVLALMISDLYI